MMGGIVNLTPQSTDEIIAELIEELNQHLDHFWHDLGQSGSFVQYVREHLPDTGDIVTVTDGNGFVLAEDIRGGFNASHLYMLFPGDTKEADRKRWRVKLARHVATAIDEVQSLCSEGEYLDAWQELAQAQSLMLILRLGNIEDVKKAAKRPWDARHKDSRADRKFIQQWYKENRAQFRNNKDRAANFAFENKLVSRAWRTIRGYLDNL